MAVAADPAYRPGTADYYRSYLASSAIDAATRAGLPDPNGFAMVVLAQVEAESHFNPNASSSAGARGITQIVPSDHPGAPPASDPLGQLRWTANYMAGLVKRYGTFEDALSVYNSGKPWSIGQGIAQTRSYVSKILGAVGRAVTGTAGSYGVAGTAAGQDAFGGVALGPASTIAGGLSTSVSNPLSTFAAIGKLIATLLDPHTWYRVGLVLGGGVLIVGGLVLIARNGTPLPV